ncbi:MAG: uroporphyrinogen-III synthase [Pseudomonadales bacterium]
MCPADLKRRSVLLTRPDGYNDNLARKLEAANVDVVERPLLKIQEKSMSQGDKQMAMDLDLVDDIIFVSGNAVEFGLDWLRKYWPQWPAALRWFAVGPATAARLRAQADVEPVFPERGASDALLEMPEGQSVAGRRMLIVRGVGGREKLADTLRARGADVHYLEAYERKPVDYGPESAREFGQRNFDVAVVTSGEALVQLARLVSSADFPAKILVPSKRVRSLAIELGFAKVRVVEDVADEALMQAISAID